MRANPNPDLLHAGSFTSAISVPTYPLPEIAFIGRSNVGKSSLLNCLTGLNKKIAVESKTPGRTQAINLFKCSDKEGDICVFVDLPGYGFAKMSKDQQAGIGVFLSGYLEERGPLKLVILLGRLLTHSLLTHIAAFVSYLFYQ